MEEVKNGILVKCQKVFDNGLGKQNISNCHETPQGVITHIIRAFHQFGAYLGKLANPTFVNPRNQQKWTCVDLVDKITSP